MSYVKINGKKIADLSRNEMAEFFTEQVFYGFMDNGKYGIRNAVADAVQTKINWSEELAKRSTLVFVHKSRDEDDKLINYTTMRVISMLAKRGTDGVESALIDMFDTIANDRLKHKRD